MTPDRKRIKVAKHDIMTSKPSRQIIRVVFINKSERKAMVIWIDFKGTKVSYKTLQPHQSQFLSTFVDHIWIFEDVETGERLVTTHGDEVCVIPNPVDNDKTFMVEITIPVFSLVSLCMRSIHQEFTSEEIKHFYLPSFLKKELLQYIDKKSYAEYKPNYNLN